MKQLWLSENECTACAACMNICPQDAIRMEYDQYGFAYPKISNQCIECNVCEIACKKRGRHVEKNETSPRTYAAWSKDEQLRFMSTSGGAFSELAQIIINNGGIVVGAQYNQNNVVEHVLIDTAEGLERIRQSKYVQSNIGTVFREIKQILNSGRVVAFCGAPCQVAGLYAFLGKNLENLITMDFICRGVNSPKAYRAWLKELESNHESNVERVWFKYKINGWKNSPLCTRIDFENGKKLVQSQKENLFMKGYLGPNLYIRPSCGNCAFKGVPRQGDITLADFWGLDSALDDDKGTSLVLINNEKGAMLLEKAQENMNIYERNFEEIFSGNQCFSASVDINRKSKRFLKSLDVIKFSKAVRKYTRRTFIGRILNKLKRVVIRN